MMQPSRDSARAALHGALLLMAVGAYGVAMLLVVSVIERNVNVALGALALLALLLAGGAVGGLVHHATARARSRGWLGAAASWSLAALAPLLMITLASHALISRLALSGLDANRAELLIGWPALKYIGLATVLFGLIVAQAAIDDRPPLFVSLNDVVPRGTILVWVAVALIGWTGYDVLLKDVRLPLPTNPADARRILHDAQTEARRRPNDEQTQMALGLALMHLGRFAEAQPRFERAELLDPQDTYPLNALGWTLNQQRRFVEAVPHLQTAVHLDPSYGYAQQNLGWALFNLDRLAEAERAYRAAMQLMPENARAAGEYGFVLRRLHKPQLALLQTLRAAKLDPRNPAHHVNAAQLLRNAGRLDESKAHLAKALRLAPEIAGFWGEMGVTEYLRGDATAAATAFAEAARRDSAYFQRRPMERSMWRSAKLGHTGEVAFSRPDVTDGGAIAKRGGR